MGLCRTSDTYQLPLCSLKDKSAEFYFTDTKDVYASSTTGSLRRLLRLDAKWARRVMYWLPSEAGAKTGKTLYCLLTSPVEIRTDNLGYRLILLKNLGTVNSIPKQAIPSQMPCSSLYTWPREVVSKWTIHCEPGQWSQINFNYFDKTHYYSDSLILSFDTQFSEIVLNFILKSISK